MSILLKKVKVFDPNSSLHGKKLDLYVNTKGILEKYESQKAKKVIEEKGLVVFPGLCDLQVNFCEPGLEHKENIASGLRAASKGGITATLQVPNVVPAIDNKETITYVKSKANEHLTTLLVQCGISQSLKGKALTEVLDASDHGADAFGDGYHNVWHSGLLLKALQYLQHTDKVLFNQPYDVNLAEHGLMHEGVVSTVNGIHGIPSFVESMAISRDLEILRYAGGRLHFSQISTAKGVELIKKAKKEGLQVTCGVSYYHLIKTDEELSTFETNDKIMPPLRDEKDRKALLKGVKEGTVDVIVSNHRPQEQDCKKLEFNYADNGKIGVQSLFLALKTFTDLEDEVLYQALVANPRTLINKSTELNYGSEAEFFFFKEEKYELTKSEILSKSYNTSEIGTTYDFRIHGVVNGNKYEVFGK